MPLRKEVLSFGPFRLAPGERLLTREGAPVELGARALDILVALLSRPNEVISKKELLSHVWPDVTVEESSLRFHMASLRKALGDGKDGARYITTLAGRGYCFVAPVTRSHDEVEAETSVAADFPHADLPGRTQMVGRDDDVLRISNDLIAARFVSIVGVGGVGKTTVAIAVGHHLTEAFKGAVLFVDLGMLGDPGLVATAIASMLGLSVQSEDATPALIAYLRSKRMLLILDTCEHLIDAVAALTSQIYAKARQVHILATSREVLQVEGEHVYRLDTLACPPEDAEIVSAAAQTFPAPRLFIERAAASGARLDLGDAEVAIVVRICRKLDGVALAIELAARRVEAYGLHRTETLLDQHLTLLLLGHRSSTPRQRTLQATLDWSYQLLSELERVVLRRLAVFVGHFTLDAALAVVTGTDIDQSQVIGGIESLVGKSMIATYPVGAMMRYRLLDTTRAYVLNIAIDDTEAADLAVRHATYYRRWLEQSGGEWLMLSTGLERSAHFAALNNARSALDWCFGHGGNVENGIGLAAAAAPVFLAMSLLPECNRWSERAIRALDETARSGPEEMQLQAALGVSLMYTQGSTDRARIALSRSLTIAEERHDVPNQVALLGALCLFHHREADLRMGVQYAKRSQALAGTIETPAVIAFAHGLLGTALHMMGALADARMELEASLHHWSRFQRTSTRQMDYPSLAVILACTTFSQSYAAAVLARTLWLQGYPAQAVERTDQVIRAAERTNHPTSRVGVLAWAPGIFLWTGDFESAERHIDSSIALAESYSLAPFVTLGRGFKAVLATRRGDAKGGVESLRACLDALHSLYKLPISLLNLSLSEGLGKLGRFNEGVALVDETIRSVQANQELTFMPELLRVKGGLFLSMPHPDSDAAEACFAQSLELSRHQGARSWELRTAVDLARLWANRGRPEDGRRLLQPILEQFTEGRDTADLQTAGRLLAELGQDQ